MPDGFRKIPPLHANDSSNRRRGTVDRLTDPSSGERAATFLELAPPACSASRTFSKSDTSSVVCVSSERGACPQAKELGTAAALGILVGRLTYWMMPGMGYCNMEHSLAAQHVNTGA